ncbi:MAG TPA: hypothetical protein DHD79_12315 [Firmicutes bacterium]|nr:hypothetical protein [Bacillota bacterium]HAW70676.1 hypothetical protein [Bacillota bacterium]HAZ21123.1 hypothetical protein [Bacillota bacterium]HBE06031.1 hypothetical protein [Bacillota bacterium]HBG42918.1 hypothetical protein [Bacillota bacterium]
MPMQELHLLVILAIGGFGGLLNHLYIHDNRFLLPRLTGNDGEIGIALGFLADFILGAGAALATRYLILNGNNATVIAQAAIALIAGFGGGSFLAKNAVELEKERFKTVATLQMKTNAISLHAGDPKRISEMVARAEKASCIYELRKIQNEMRISVR